MATIEELEKILYAMIEEFSNYIGDGISFDDWKEKLDEVQSIVTKLQELDNNIFSVASRSSVVDSINIMRTHFEESITVRIDDMVTEAEALIETLTDGHASSEYVREWMKYTPMYVNKLLAYSISDRSAISLQFKKLVLTINKIVNKQDKDNNA